MLGRRVGRRGLIGTVARTAVVAGTATAVAGGVRSHQDAKAQQAADAQAYEQQQQQQAQMPAPAPPVAAATGAPSDLMAQLQQLADMRSQGLLSDSEFAAAKAKLLG